MKPESIDAWVSKLRQEWRVKLGTDYSYTLKYGELRVMCHGAFQPTIQEQAEANGLSVAEWFVYPSR